MAHSVKVAIATEARPNDGGTSAFDRLTAPTSHSEQQNEAPTHGAALAGGLTQLGESPSAPRS
jgi:hypothetical protein